MTSTNPAIVHHTIVYAQLPADKAAVDALDAADPLPGYECFGGAGWAGAIEVGAAAVGSQPLAFPNGSGAPLPAGTRYVVQVHYNFDNGHGSNRIAVQAWSAPTLTQIPHGLVDGELHVRHPARRRRRDRHRHRRLHDDAGRRQPDAPGPLVGRVPAHAPDRQLDPRRPRARRRLEVVRHQRARSGTSTGRAATSSRSRSRSTPATACRRPASGTTPPRTSRSSTACVQQPKDVRFGEGSTDEMCLAGFTLTDF